MSARVALYIAVILLFLLAIAVIAVAALVRRPRREWQTAVMGQRQDVRGRGLSDLRLKTVRPRRVTLDEMWATNSVAQSAYVGAPQLPSKEMVSSALAPPQPQWAMSYVDLDIRQDLAFGRSHEAEWEETQADGRSRWAPASEDGAAEAAEPLRPPPPPTAEDVLYAVQLAALADDRPGLPQSPDDAAPTTSRRDYAPPAPPRDYITEDSFYGPDVHDGLVSVANAGLTTPRFDDQKWEGYVHQPDEDAVDAAAALAVAVSAATKAQGAASVAGDRAGELISRAGAWARGVAASARGYLETRKKEEKEDSGQPGSGESAASTEDEPSTSWDREAPAGTPTRPAPPPPGESGLAPEEKPVLAAVPVRPASVGSQAQVGQWAHSAAAPLADRPDFDRAVFGTTFQGPSEVQPQVATPLPSPRRTWAPSDGAVDGKRGFSAPSPSATGTDTASGKSIRQSPETDF